MSVMQGFAATARRGAMFALIGILIPVLSHAQATARAGTRASQEARARERAQRDAQEKLIERVDSLRWEFEHERMSEQEREELRQQMAQAFRTLAESMTQLRDSQMHIAREASRAAREWSGAPEMRVMVRTARPSGYLGLSFDGMNSEDVRDGEHFVRFYQYPMIALVEPSSPAERAGIRRGDTLLALNGTDVVKTEVALSRMLVPDAKVTVRVRRGGAATNIAVVVGRAPEYVRRRFTPPAIAAAPAPPPAVRVRTPDLPEAAVAPAPPVMNGYVWVSSDGIGGARLETVTEGWAKTLGVNAGVLVVRALAGTPAYESGLRDGDVIVRASGKPVTTVRELRNALSWESSDEGTKVVIVRERKQKELTLRW